VGGRKAQGKDMVGREGQGRGAGAEWIERERVPHLAPPGRSTGKMGYGTEGNGAEREGEWREERGEARLHTRRLRSGAQNQQQKRTQGHQWHTGPERTLGKHKRILLVPGASLDGRLAALGSNRPCRAAWSAVPAHGARREAVR